MKKAILIVGVLLALVAFCLAAEVPFPKSIVPADAVWAIHFDIDTFLKTKIYAAMERDMPFKGFGVSREKISEILGGDITEILDKITVIGIGRKEEPVVCFEGNIPRERLLNLLKEEGDYETLSHGSSVIYHWDRNEYGAFIGDRMLLFSEDLDGMKDVLDVISGGKPSLKAQDVLANVEAQSAATPIVAFIRDLSALVGASGGPAILNLIGTTFLQASEKGEDVLISLNLDTPSNDDAVQVEKVINGLVALASMEQGNRASAFNIDPEKLSVKVKGSQVDISLAYPVEGFVKLVLGRGAFAGFASFASLRSLH